MPVVCHWYACGMPVASLWLCQGIANHGGIANQEPRTKNQYPLPPTWTIRETLGGVFGTPAGWKNRKKSHKGP